mgnify:CR=1 FL=1
MSEILHDSGLDLIFREARTHNSWKDEPVSDVMLQAVYDLARYGATSANCSPMRVVFVKSPEAKERLKPHLSEGNVEKTMSAPATAIIGHDLEFHEHLPRLFPHTDARAWFQGEEKTKHREDTAFRNGTLQGAYLMISARALGLDCGPMSGFDPAGVDRTFFAGTTVRSNFLCNLGYGDPSRLFPRSPRLECDEACEIV